MTEEDTPRPPRDEDRERWHVLQRKLDEINPYEHGAVLQEQLSELRELGRRVETVAMARVLRWFRDTALATARQRQPGLPAWDEVDRDVSLLLRQLEGS
jgi:hypothetical protein